MFRRLVFFFFLTTLIWSPARAQTAAPARDPQALALIASSLKALTGRVAVHDVIMEATANYIAGSDEESGTATLTARGNQQSSVQLNLDGGTRQEIRNGPAGAWSGPDGTAHSTATHNCWTDASWFFPALTLEAVASDPQTAISYLGPDTSKGEPLLHLRLMRAPPRQSAGVTIHTLGLSAMDIYLDPNSFLPMVIDFDTHPDIDANTTIPVEILFGNFQRNSGGLVPLHIQKHLQGTLLLDLVVTNVALNAGVPQSAFTLPAVPGGGEQ